jgi:hypothetical protein
MVGPFLTGAPQARQEGSQGSARAKRSAPPLDHIALTLSPEGATECYTRARSNILNLTEKKPHAFYSS